eukprot:TRINITY_DN29935_c0_g1_i1.p1 TRINITY_DN29935_c0_g1~~TRINITY_DN29935_c0_g1_i1.p1  ORF type:complete len:235 (+),score=48.56 TRINITY_DN29935_c0_g1_i1:104-808(+)
MAFSVPEVPTACDASTSALLAVLILVGLIANFFGYRLYHAALPVFAFFLAGAAEAAIGAQWIAQDPGAGLPKKAIVVICCLLWGTIAAALCKKYMEAMHKIIGFLLGATVGAVAVAAVVQLIQYNFGDQVPSGYGGWEHFAIITFGVPGALLAGYLARNSVKYFLILATALLGSLVAMRSLATILSCANVDSEVIDRPVVQYVGIAVLASLGICAQLCSQPKAKQVYVTSAATA